MANFDCEDILKRIHRKVELNVDYPTAGDDDYNLRLGLLNDYNSTWEREEGVLWKELWKVASFSSTSTATYDLSSSVSDLRIPGGFVELVPTSGASSYWRVENLEKVRLLVNTQEPFAYFTGNPQAGFTLNFNSNLYPGAGTIKFPYYKKVAALANTTDKPDMSDPEYLVHSVVSDLKSSDDPGESDRQYQLAQNKLRAMKTLNAMDVDWMSSRVEDKAGVTHGSGFGY